MDADDNDIAMKNPTGPHTIALSVSGRAADDGHVLLPGFINLLKAARLLVKRADEAANGRTTAKVRIVDLSHSSPATVTMDLVPINPKHDTRPRVMEKMGVLRQLETSEYKPTAEDWPVIEALEALTASVVKDVETATLAFGDNLVQLSPRLNQRVVDLLASGITCYGSVEGRLEQINLHLGANVFTIYPVIGARKIQCHFTREHLADVIGAINHRVRVAGALRYKPEADFPSELIVESVERLCPDEELPQLSDMLGRMPDAAGGRPSEEFIRLLRDEWE